MDRKRLSWGVVVVGAALLAVSALADPIGLGDGGGTGWKQILGMVAGAVVIVVGLALMRGLRRGEGSAQANV